MVHSVNHKTLQPACFCSVCCNTFSLVAFSSLQCLCCCSKRKRKCPPAIILSFQVDKFSLIMFGVILDGWGDVLIVACLHGLFIALLLPFSSFLSSRENRRLFSRSSSKGGIEQPISPFEKKYFSNNNNVLNLFSSSSLFKVIATLIFLPTNARMKKKMIEQHCHRFDALLELLRCFGRSIDLASSSSSIVVVGSLGNPLLFSFLKMKHTFISCFPSTALLLFLLLFRLLLPP